MNLVYRQLREIFIIKLEGACMDIDIKLNNSEYMGHTVTIAINSHHAIQ